MSSSDTQQQESHDLICIGFGPAAISLGITLKEAQPSADIVFLENEPKSTWRPLGDLPGHTHMTANFLSDLITLENPRSKFTFIQFLHQKKLLVDFTNLGSMEPSRGIFEDYLSWCAKEFEKKVRHDTQIFSIEPSYSQNRKIDGWNVTTTNKATRQRTLYTSKRVVISAKQQPQVPAILSRPSLRQSVIHSSQCMTRLSKLTHPTATDIRIAIVGQTQQAAELFDELYDVRADRHVSWFVEDATLQPESRSNFATNTNFQPSSNRVPPELIISEISHGTIDPSLLTKIYERQYAQSIKQPDPTTWKYQIKLNHTTTHAEHTSSHRIHLSCLDRTTRSTTHSDFDLIIAATGFTRSSHDQLFSTLSRDRLLDGPSVTVNADYLVNLRRNIREPGIALWCVGSIGETDKAVGDGAFRIMAQRSARVVQSILEYEDTGLEAGKQEGDAERVQAQL